MAITRTWALTRGHALSIFVVYLILSGIAFVVFLVPILMLVGSLASIGETGDPTGAVGALLAAGGYERVHTLDPELYFDDQYTPPATRLDAEGRRQMTWPEAGLWRPRDPGPGPEFWLLTGAEPARTWQAFASEFIDVALRDDITGRLVQVEHAISARSDSLMPQQTYAQSA
jgi:hypothetical protein